MRVPRTAGLLIENIRKKALTGIFRGLLRAYTLPVCSGSR
jgi:hypothetical protein